MADSGPTERHKTCRFFQTKKGCKFGDDCRFLHLKKLSSESGNVLHDADKGQKQCKVINRENPCSEDIDHDPLGAHAGKEMEEQKDSSSDRQEIVCKFFQRKKGCLRGDKCPFKHVIGDGGSLSKPSDTNPGKSRVRTKKQTANQQKEIPIPVTENAQETNQRIKSEKYDKTTGRTDPLAQEDNVNNCIVTGQGSGVELSNTGDVRKHVESGKGVPCLKNDNTAKGVDTGIGISLPKGDSVTRNVKSGKGNSLPKKYNVTKGAESGNVDPLPKKGDATKDAEGEQGIPVLNKDNVKAEKAFPLSQENHATRGAAANARQRDTLPNKENVRRHVQSRQGVPLHNRDSAANVRGTFTLGDAIFVEPKRLRSTEIQQLKRRFGSHVGYCEIKENSSYKIRFKPTDPDWPFKIEAVYLTVCFPDDYPLQIFNVSLSKEQGLPQDIINFVTQHIQQWTTQQEQLRKSQGTLKLYFRPFLRWFDKNIASLFIDGGKQMTKSYVSNITDADNTACELPSNSLASEGQVVVTNSPPDQECLQDIGYDGHCSNAGTEKTVQINAETLGDSYTKEDSKGLEMLVNDVEPSCCTVQVASSSGIHDSAVDHVTNNRATNTDASHDSNMLDVDPLKQVVNTGGANFNCEQSLANEHAAQSSQSDTYGNNASVLNTAERGTQIQLKGLNLEENTSSMRGNKVVFTLECCRCRQRIDQQLSASVSVVKQCTRCASAFAVTYRPTIIHQFSSVLGYLDLEGCAPFDVVLPESELLLGCFHCSKETSVKGLQYGANWSWCSHCHQKLRFQIQSTRFQQLQSSASNTAVPLRKTTVSSTSAKPKKQSQSSGMKEGQPLPANGSCKHYKKSYRWLRFPCCGKCYPCDLCHEEGEDHEMKYATRMVCGFCSREQPYSQQPCSGCKAAVTKSRSAHWEGGKGCRDKTAMSRNDDQKYKQSGKTTSRKAQKRSEGKGKGHKG